MKFVELFLKNSEEKKMEEIVWRRKERERRRRRRLTVMESGTKVQVAQCRVRERRNFLQIFAFSNALS